MTEEKKPRAKKQSASDKASTLLTEARDALLSVSGKNADIMAVIAGRVEACRDLVEKHK
jgi:hypothetical protein